MLISGPRRSAPESRIKIKDGVMASLFVIVVVG
jgi:hypothetical protein